MTRTCEVNTAVAVYRTLQNVERAIGSLQNSGIDLRKVSIAGKDHLNGNGHKGDPNPFDRSMCISREETLWEKMLRLLPGTTFYSLPDDEFVIVSGPLFECATSALDNPVIFGRLSTLCAGLYILGVPIETALRFEEEVHHNKFLVMAIGTTDEVVLVKEILQSINGTDP